MRLLPHRKPNVDKLRRKGNLDDLREALFYWESFVDDEGTEWDAGVEIRTAAAEALSDFSDPAAAAILSQALEDPQPAVRLAAVKGLAKLNIAVSAEPLLRCAVDPGDAGEALSEQAVDVLAAWRLEGTADALVELMLEPDAPPLDDRHRDALERVLAVDARGQQARATVAQGLIARLQAPLDDWPEGRAAQILAWLGPSSVEGVLEALDNGRAAPAVIRAAGGMGDARLVDGIVQALESDDPEMRRSAAAAAQALNHTRAVPALLAATQDPEQSVRDAASAALDGMGTAAVIAGLAALMPEPSEDRLPPGAEERLLAELRRQMSPAPGPPDIEQPPSTPPVTPARRSGGLVERLLGRGE